MAWLILASFFSFILFVPWIIILCLPAIMMAGGAYAAVVAIPQCRANSKEKCIEKEIITRIDLNHAEFNELQASEEFNLNQATMVHSSHSHSSAQEENRAESRGAAKLIEVYHYNHPQNYYSNNIIDSTNL